MIKGDQVPVLQEGVLYRTKEALQLFHNKVVNDTVAKESDGIACAPFRKFGLYLDITFTGTADTITLHIEVEFLDRRTGKWYTFKQGPFASLYYEDEDTASGICECFVGDVVGRDVRVKLTGADVSSSNYFTVSVGMDFWN